MRTLTSNVKCISDIKRNFLVYLYALIDALSFFCVFVVLLFQLRVAGRVWLEFSEGFGCCLHTPAAKPSQARVQLSLPVNSAAVTVGHFICLHHFLVFVVKTCFTDVYRFHVRGGLK